MKGTPLHGPPRHRDRTNTRSLAHTLVASTLLALGIVTAVLAILYPIIAMDVAALAFASWIAVRMLRRAYRARQRDGRTNRVCVPKTSVCVDV